MPESRNKNFLLIFVLLVIGGLIFSYSLPLGSGSSRRATQYRTSPSPQLVTITQSQDGQLLRYDGVDGKTALDLLKSGTKVKTKNFAGQGEFVESINGLAGDEKHFWAFYVNGQPAQVGAGSYTTKAGEIIEWKYEEIK